MLKNITKSKWQIVKFGDIALHIKDRVVREETGLKYYLGGEHFDNGEIHIRRKGIIAESPIGPAFHMRFKPGHVLIVSRNPHLRKASLANFEGICANTTYVCEAIKGKLLPNFLPFVMQSDAFWFSAEVNKRGSTNPYLNWGDFARFQLKLPSLEEQKRIADLLWSVDDVEERYINLLKKLTICQNSYFNEMYQDKKCEAKSISEIAEINPRIKRNSVSGNTPVSFITMADVSEEGFILNKQDRPYSNIKNGLTPFEENDILFAKITPCMENGKGAIALGLTNKIGFGSTEFHVLRPKSVSDKSYLFYLTMMSSLRKKAEQLMTGSAGQKRVPTDFFDFFKVKFPGISKRKLIGEQMESFDETISNVKNCIDAARTIKKQIINQISYTE